MSYLSRVFLPVSAFAALALLVTGCAGAHAGAASPAPSSSASRSAAVTGLDKGAPAGTVVYLAEGATVTGKALRAPACAADCQLSGDSTAWLRHMTWSKWNSAVAAGTGTERIDDCTPNCAQGTLHAVPVVVRLDRPVMVCADGAGTWFWTRASFTWPAGLPAALRGDNAPANHLDYAGIAGLAAKSC